MSDFVDSDFIEAARDCRGPIVPPTITPETVHHLRGPRQLELGEVFGRQCAGAQLREVFRCVNERQVVPRRGLRLDEIAGLE